MTMRWNATRIATAAAFAVGLTVSGCGGDDAEPRAVVPAAGDTTVGTTSGTGGAAGGIARQAGARATGRFIDANGQEVGEVTLEESAEGVFVRGELRGLAGPVHGFHFHEVGRCEPPFQSAGGHFNPAGRQHGLASASGPHAGDMPNIFVSGDGTARIEAFVALVTLGSGPHGLLDGDGTAIVVHAGPDDHSTDPSGNSGDRVACAVLQR